MTSSETLSPRTTDGSEIAAVAAKVGASGSSFYTAMRVLPLAKRQGMFAVYAFCREVDDIADEPAPEEQKRRELEAWRQEIDRLFQGRPGINPVARALAVPIVRFGLRREDFLGVIDGMAMDAEQDIQAPSHEDLRLYCDRVACAVGRLSVRIFGPWTPRSDDVAEHLGHALQLTNILRDLDEDGERGRLYLPRELLRRHGIAATDPATVLADPRIDAVCRELAAEAAGHFAEAERAMADCPRRDMRPAAMMEGVYSVTLQRLLARGWTAPRAEVKLPKLYKVWLALKAGYL